MLHWMARDHISRVHQRERTSEAPCGKGSGPGGLPTAYHKASSAPVPGTRWLLLAHYSLIHVDRSPLDWAFDQRQPPAYGLDPGVRRRLSACSTSRLGIWMELACRQGVFHPNMRCPHAQQEVIHQGLLSGEMETIHCLASLPPLLTGLHIHSYPTRLPSATQKVGPCPQLHLGPPDGAHAFLPRWTVPLLSHS